MITIWNPFHLTKPSTRWTFYRFMNDANLGLFLESLANDNRVTALFDCDLRYREILIIAPEDQMDAVEEAAKGYKGRRAGTGPMMVEVPVGSGQGSARRSYIRGRQHHQVVISLSLDLQGDPHARITGENLCDEELAGEPAVSIHIPEGMLPSSHWGAVCHGVRRACFRGPSAGFPVRRAIFRLTEASCPGDAPSIGDVHAATILAAGRALGASGTRLCLLAGEATACCFPDLESSVAQAGTSLASVAEYQLDQAAENEAESVSAFAAYLLSQVFGYNLGDSMVRQPTPPSESLRGVMSLMASTLMERIAIVPDGTAKSLVSNLLGSWTAPWVNNDGTGSSAFTVSKFK